MLSFAIMQNTESLAQLRHSLAHLLGAAVLKIWPDTKLAIGPAIENGFYYDFDFATPITEADLPKIEKEMEKLLKTWKEFTHKEVSEAEAKKIYKDNPYKIELIEEIAKKGEPITLYTSGEFTDLCRGGHVENPSKDIDSKAFELTRLAGAYWRGDEKNKMLTRIYGLAFETKEMLDEYLNLEEEAKKRDHKKLGKELDLFTFSELVGPGLPLWTPKGTVLRDLLDAYVFELRSAVGYERVEIPHITKKDLYEKSGHWAKFSDELFRMKTREDHEFAMKPMNCPHHTQIYARKQWSYRDLPQRYANTTMVYRDEQTGELSGLSRVRSITQDDAHVFCRQAQVKEEIGKIYDIVTKFYGTFGFTLAPRLSLHDPKKMEKYLGTAETWKTSEAELRDLVKEKGATAIEAVGEAAFYGPKIDFMTKDSLGREWQVATIQLDMNMPERFDLYCINEKSEKERIVMIHAAIMGSLERFISILIEHYAGAFPLWLSPVQVKVIPVGEKFLDYARGVFEKLKTAGVRAELDESNEGLGKKIRAAKVEKIPYFLVLGEKEMTAQNVTLESRDKGKVGEMTVEEAVEKLSEEIRLKK